MAKVLEIVGSIAGIGGISLGVLLYLYRDIIGRKIFPTLSSAHATVLLGSMIVFTFAVAVLGIFAGLAAGAGALPFITLVAVILAFIVAVLLITTRFMANRTARSPGKASRYGRISELIDANELDEADQELSRVAGKYQASAEFWYWRSRVALARENVDVAGRYVDEALARDGTHGHSVALKIKLLLLTGKDRDRRQAKARAEQSYGISGELDAWLACLTANDMFKPGVRPSTELEARCPLPTPIPSREPTT